MPHEIERETTITEQFSVTIPSPVWRAASIEAGDTIRWQVDDDGSLSVELRRQQYGVFDHLNAVDIGESTDAANDHDLGGREF